jgi:hypothetical protein
MLYMNVKASVNVGKTPQEDTGKLFLCCYVVSSLLFRKSSLIYINVITLFPVFNPEPNAENPKIL